jgi:hypothetical protein
VKNETTKKLLEVVKFTIANNATIEQIMGQFSMSRRTAQKFVNEYLLQLHKETNDEQYKVFYDQIKKIQSDNLKLSKVEIDPNEVARMKVTYSMTNELLAKLFEVSESTIISKLKEVSTEYIEKLSEVNSKNIELGRYVGGKNGIRGPGNTDFDILEIAQTMLEEQLTLKIASVKYGIPISTLYEGLMRLDYDNIKTNLQILFDTNYSNFFGKKSK